MSLRDQLKRETATVHERVEAELNVLRRDFSEADYRSLLATFLGFYRPCEDRLKAATAGTRYETLIAERLKSPALVADLQAAGYTSGEIRDLPEADELPRIATIADVLGVMYVLEGSTLGGVVIARHLRQHFSWPASDSFRFFNVYGDQVSQRWTAFVQLLAEQASEDVAPRVCQAARYTFECLEGWLQHSNTPKASDASHT
ncbi:biliverdin-producing heme oxygenase [Anatilimnocola sp. NA78]|uniref:biliverdin-producing heme oxygenase n=1 Tax=Anatilimnocola sp. NA78 TaxID=3415683 RepID=UPI003CE480F4